MTERETVVEALRQVMEGDDIATADWIGARLQADDAVRKPPGAPHSIADVAWHTWFWVRAWNRWVRDDGDPYGGLDNGWSDVAAADWPALRDSLAEELAEAKRLAATADLERMTGTGHTTSHDLLAIAAHTAYHVGQMALILQQLGLWPPSGGE